MKKVGLIWLTVILILGIYYFCANSYCKSKGVPECTFARDIVTCVEVVRNSK